MVDIVVGLADRASATELTTLHRAVARFAYADIFPPEAPPPTYEEDLARWEHWLGPDWEQGRRAHVALIGQRVVGVILAGPDTDDRTLGHIARLYVDPSCWGRGVGTLLYRAALADVTERGFPAATLWVLEANRRVRDWYERLGWAATGRRKPVYAPAGIDDVQYRIDLDPGLRRQTAAPSSARSASDTCRPESSG